MFWVQFTHFYSQRWSLKPSKKYIPTTKKGHRCNIQTQASAELDCAQNCMTVETTHEPEAWAPPKMLHELNKYHFL